MTTNIQTTNSSPARGVAGSRLDPRLYQIAVLASLLLYGKLFLAFDVDLSQVLFTVAGALLVQATCGQLTGLAFEPRSALISALSLCLLLRANSPAWAVLAAAIAVASKFVLRVRGKHLFNPTNFALVVLVLATDGVWVSPAQWGTKTVFAFALASAGLFVVNRSARSDVTLAFLLFHAAVLFGRAFWLGDPLAIPLRQLSSGGLVLFAFFMISDPKTTPDSRAGRILFAALAALGAGFVQFGLYRPNGLLYGLVAACLAVPFLDRWLPGGRFEWGVSGDDRRGSFNNGRDRARPLQPDANILLKRPAPVPAVNAAAVANAANPNAPIIHAITKAAIPIPAVNAAAITGGSL